MGIYTFTTAQTGLPEDITVDARWIQSTDPFVCTFKGVDVNGDRYHADQCHVPATCSGHIADSNDGTTGGLP